MNINSLCLFEHDNCLPTHVSPWPHNWYLDFFFFENQSNCYRVHGYPIEAGLFNKKSCPLCYFAKSILLWIQFLCVFICAYTYSFWEYMVKFEYVGFYVWVCGCGSLHIIVHNHIWLFVEFYFLIYMCFQTQTYPYMNSHVNLQNI